MRRFVAILLCALLCAASAAAQPAGDAQRITILFTSDMHSHTERFPALATCINAARAQGECLLVDGGDFTVGTLTQTLFTTHAAELALMGAMGYDATILGNHEFDFQPEGLCSMLHVAAGDANRPAFLVSSVDWAANQTESARELKTALDAYGAQAYTILERNGIKIGLFGLLGADADACAPTSGLDFLPNIDAARAAVAQLRDAGAELIVCLSHSGVHDDPAKSEDALLAKAVPEIDVIVSGHMHTRLDTPIAVGDTWIVAPGEYAEYLGEIKLRRAGARWTMDDYKLVPTQGVAPDDAIASRVARYDALVDETYMARFGYRASQVIAENEARFETFAQCKVARGETALGNFIADAFRSSVRAFEGEESVPVDVAIVPIGVVRAGLPTGAITARDAFQVLSMGVGYDGLSGHPLVSAYFTGRELRDLAEVDATVASVMPSTELFASGLGWAYNEKRLFLNRAYDVWRIGADGAREELDEDKLYRVVVDLYSCQMLGAVRDKSFGLLSLVPKDENAQPVTDFEKRVIRDGAGRELKAWQALAMYMESLGTIPAAAGAAQGRKIRSEGLNPAELLRNPNAAGKLAIGACVALAAIVVFGVLGARALRGRKKRGEENPVACNRRDPRL